MEAYKVEAGDDEGRAVIVFAEAWQAAAARGGAELNMDTDEIASCVRAPDFDGYADLGYVPADALVAHGWGLECGGYGQMVDSDCLDDHGSDPVFDGREAYCSAGCRDVELRAARQRRRVKQIADTILHHQVAKRWPGACVARTHVYICKDRIEQALAYFTFPGARHGFATFIARDENSVHRRNEEMPLLQVPRGDIEAFRAFSRQEEVA